MNKIVSRPVFLLIVCGILVAVSASPPIVGVARSPGTFRLNDAPVPGTATLLDGATIATIHSASDVNLTHGGRLMLASASAATLHRDRLILDRGAAELNRAASYRIETRDLRIQGVDAAARIRVAVDASHRVQIAALAGSAEVRNSQGLLVARVLPGTALQVQPTGDSATRLTGQVCEQNGKYFLTDETNNVTVELRGPNLKSKAGRRVQVTGSPAAGETPATGASQVVNVTAITDAGKGKQPAAAVCSSRGGAAAAAGGAAAGAAGGAAGGAAAGAAAGASVATIAVIGGAVATAGTVGGLVASGTVGGGGEPIAGKGGGDTISR